MAPDNRVEERIAGASLIDDDPGLISIRDRWKPLGLSLEMLRCHRLETSSTSSVIQIYAKQLRSRDLTAETSSAGNPPDGLSRIDDLDALMGRTTTQKFCRRLMTMFAIRQLRQG
jgi:hypothetical protein